MLVTDPTCAARNTAAGVRLPHLCMPRACKTQRATSCRCGHQLKAPQCWHLFDRDGSSKLLPVLVLPGVLQVSRGILLDWHPQILSHSALHFSIDEKKTQDGGIPREAFSERGGQTESRNEERAPHYHPRIARPASTSGQHIPSARVSPLLRVSWALARTRRVPAPGASFLLPRFLYPCDDRPERPGCRPGPRPGDLQGG